MNEPFTEEHARTLLHTLRGHDLEAIITLALVTGMRREELLRLTWQDIDLEKRELRVPHTKTKSLVIHVSEGVTEVLTQHHMRQMEARLEASTTWQNLDLVFPDHTGGFLKPHQLVKGWYEILEEAALPRMRFHDLREARWRQLRARLRAANEGRDGAQAGFLDLAWPEIEGGTSE